MLLEESERQKKKCLHSYAQEGLFLSTKKQWHPALVQTGTRRHCEATLLD